MSTNPFLQAIAVPVGCTHVSLGKTDSPNRKARKRKGKRNPLSEVKELKS